MQQRSEFNRKSGVYRSHDLIDNFKFRVTLRKVSNFINLHQFETVPTANEIPNSSESCTISIDWQQKHFSAKELTQFADADKCQTDLHKRYHQECINLMAIQPNTMVYTYIAEDGFVPTPECISSNQEHFVTFEQKADSADTSMLVMAKLLDNVETVLFTITWKPAEETLLVYPDFNDIESNPYVKEIDSDRRQFYHYAIENISESQPIEAANMDGLSKTMSKLNVDPNTSSSFTMPPRRCCFVTVLLEIESARDFEYDNVHVRYRVRLPDRCELIEPIQPDQQLVASTQASLKCRTSGVCWLGHSVEFSLVCQEDYNIDDYVRIDFEVISIDSWHRERTEGYTARTLALLPGACKSQLRCSRDLGHDTLLERWQRRYLGGRRTTFHMAEFHDSRPTDAESQESSSMHRFGNLTRATGMLNVFTRVIVQYDTSAMRKTMRSDRAYGDERGRGGLPGASIDDVLEAYTEAKRRLEAAAFQ